MNLIADLRHFTAPDVLQWAAGARFDGQMIFRRNRNTMALAFANGRIRRAESNEPLESFRQYLFSQGCVDLLDLAAAEQQYGEAHLTDGLLAMRVLSPRALRKACTAHTLDLTCSLIHWLDGVVAAHAAGLRPLQNLESEPLDPVYATVEAARRVDELARIRETLPHDNVSLGTRLGASMLAEWEPAQKRLLDTLVDGQTIGELYQRLGGCRFNLLQTLAGLMSRGAVIRLAVGSPPPTEPENQTTLVDVLLDSDLDRRLLRA